MEFKKGDYVTRKSYNNDTVFKILNIKDNIAYLKGIDVRLYADGFIDDLVIYESERKSDEFENSIEEIKSLDRNEYFYLPAKILHFDGDEDYLIRCLNFYKKNNLQAVGKCIKENELPNKINKFLIEYNPDIVIITGHDAYLKKRGSNDDLNSYQNSKYFCESIKNARKYEKNHDKLIIIAGACQSYYEELIKSGANYASSPKRVNIHALDPAIIASTVALTDKSKQINLIELLNKTKYGSEGMGGIVGNGLMYVGYPR
jgi:spore coat assemly protein